MSAPFELKPLMRVKTHNGMWWIVVPARECIMHGVDEGDLVLIYQKGWNTVDWKATGYGGEANGYRIVEVYEAPSQFQALNPEAHGVLLWSEATAQKRERIADIRTAIATLEKELKQLEGA